MDAIRDSGADLVAISPQMAEHNAAVKAKHGLSFPVLSDPGHGYAETLGLAWSFPDDLREIYLGFGIDLAAFHGDGSWRLPLSARIVVGADGVIRDVAADVDYTRRPEPEATVGILRSLA